MAKEVEACMSDISPGIELYEIMCKAAGFKSERVRSLTIKFEVDQPIRFTVDFMATEESVQKVIQAFKKFNDAINGDVNDTRDSTQVPTKDVQGGGGAGGCEEKPPGPV